MSLQAEPILKDEALVLRWFPVTDSSRVVVWFSSSYGRVSTLIKGSQRPKSWLLGQYDLFYTCELLFYAHANEDLHLIRECSPLNTRPALRRDWRACAGASFVADLLYRISPPQAAAWEIYRLGSLTLDQLAGGNSSPALLFWFELKILQDLGVSPDFSLESDRAGSFDYRAGRIRSGTENPDPNSHRISGGVLSLFRTLSGMDTPEKCGRIRLSPEQIREGSHHLNCFTEWHLDLRLPSRNRALDLIQR
ncbi:MAG: DNA repair protein RecO [Kiritimatiellia bacterium]